MFLRRIFEKGLNKRPLLSKLEDDFLALRALAKAHQEKLKHSPPIPLIPTSTSATSSSVTSSSSSSSSVLNSFLPTFHKILKTGESSPPPPPSSSSSSITNYRGWTTKDVDYSTRFWINSLSSSMMSDTECLRNLESFCCHLHSNPSSSSYANRLEAVGLLLSLQQRKFYNPILQTQLLEGLNLLGYHAPPPDSRGIRILSIDGGGMRGVIALEILRTIEDISGRKIHELFDFICGVSTGAIIASFLGFHQKSIQEVEETYKLIGQKVFKRNVLEGAKGYIMSHSYYNTDFYETVLKSFVGEMLTWETCRKASTPKVAIVSTLVNETRMAPFVFRNYSFPYRVQSNYKGSHSFPIWAAVRASSAAPGYFDEMVLDSTIHHDGGMMVNNASQIAIHEAQKIWPNRDIQCVVSLGLGRYDPLHFNPEKPTKSLSLTQKFARIVDSATDTELVHETLYDLLPGHVYYRFNPYLSEYISLDDTRPEKMLLMKEASKMYIRKNLIKLLDACNQLNKKGSYFSKASDLINIQRKVSSYYYRHKIVG